MEQISWETQPLANLSTDECDAALSNAAKAGEAMKWMPITAEQDRVILKAYRNGLELCRSHHALHEQQGGTVKQSDQQQLDRLSRYAGEMDRALEAAKDMTPKGITARAVQERSAASGQWHEINAKESGLVSSEGASEVEFERWEKQDLAAKAWDRISSYAETRVKEEWAASLRPVTPRKAIDELDRYTHTAIQQLKAQADIPVMRRDIELLENGEARRDASILKRLGNEPLLVSITADQTPLDRVRAISDAVDRATARTPKDERFKSAEKAVDRIATMPIATTIGSAATRFLARSETVPDANSTMERAR